MANFGIALLILGVAVQGLNGAYEEWMCSGRQYGALIPNPQDCGSYYVCGTQTAKLMHCDRGLLFDSQYLVCNWATKVTCGQFVPLPGMTRPVVEEDNSSGSGDASVAIAEPTTVAPTEPPCITQPAIASIGISALSSGKIVDAMLTYDAKHVKCVHDGVYFLPHPTQCANYFICAAGEIYMHGCGIGTVWDFKHAQCQVARTARCYPKQDTFITASGLTGQKLLPPMPTPESPAADVVEEVEAVPVILEVPAPKCVVGKKMFYAHEENCTQYYECVSGKPVLKTCPEHLLWNETEKFCGLAAYTQCKAKKI